MQCCLSDNNIVLSIYKFWYLHVIHFQYITIKTKAKQHRKQIKRTECLFVLINFEILLIRPKNRLLRGLH